MRGNAAPAGTTHIDALSSASTRPDTLALVLVAADGNPLDLLIGSVANRLQELNLLLKGWSNFYCHAWVAKRVFASLDHYVWWTILRWLRKKHRRVNMATLVRRYGEQVADRRPLLAGRRSRAVLHGSAARAGCPNFIGADGNVLVRQEPTELRSKNIIYDLHLEPWFGSMRIDEITTSEVARFRAHLVGLGTLGEKRINNILAVLSKPLKYAVDSEVLVKAPRIGMFKVEDARAARCR